MAKLKSSVQAMTAAVDRMEGARRAADEAAVLAAARDLAAVKGRDALLAIRLVRLAAGLPAARFDAAVRALKMAYVVDLHYHDLPSAIPAGQRVEMIQERGITYVGMVLR